MRGWAKRKLIFRIGSAINGADTLNSLPMRRRIHGLTVCPAAPHEPTSPGQLKPGGRYLQMPPYQTKRHRTLSNLHLTLLQAAGKPRAKFGLPDTGLRDFDQSGVIGELLV